MSEVSGCARRNLLGSPGYGTDVGTRRLDPAADVVALAAALVDIPSESLHEAEIADAVESFLSDVEHLDVRRHGNTIAASTNLGREQRVVLAGHLDTVPAHDNLPHRLDATKLAGLGACDMKGGVAIALRLARVIAEPAHDVTYFFYEGEEVASKFNGLRLIGESNPDWLACDFAILMEPSNAGVEAGCQGTLRVEVRTKGARAHSARSWKGSNAIHHATEILSRLQAYEPKTVTVDGLDYREGMNAVAISGGIAGNVIPDECVVTVNHRFAPSTSADEALTHVQELFDGFDVTVIDSVAGALPSLDNEAVKSFVQSVGASVQPKFGWTDVARFAALGIPAVNYGPGDPALAHSKDEFVPLVELLDCERHLTRWLTGI